MKSTAGASNQYMDQLLLRKKTMNLYLEMPFIKKTVTKTIKISKL